MEPCSLRWSDAKAKNGATKTGLRRGDQSEGGLGVELRRFGRFEMELLLFHGGSPLRGLVGFSRAGFTTTAELWASRAFLGR